MNAPPMPALAPARIAQELLATADALRTCRAAIAKMIRDGRFLPPVWPSVSNLMIAGLDVAQACESLAAHLGQLGEQSA